MATKAKQVQETTTIYLVLFIKEKFYHFNTAKILLVCSSVYYGYHTLPTDYHWVTVTKKTQISLDKIYSYTVILKSQRTS